MHLGRNLLFYGDNLDVLRNRIPSASVDLIYLDPPFNQQPFPLLQLLTVGDLLNGQRQRMPTPFLPYIQAKRLAAPTEQLTLG
jgi:hypothetical protein